MQTYQLKYPFTTAAGVRLEKVDIRRLNRGDLRKATAYSKDEFDQENFLLASMCGMTPEDLDG
ncbi:phage tail assembly protein, partial [Pseudomonas sp. FSL R10-0765]